MKRLISSLMLFPISAMAHAAEVKLADCPQEVRATIQEHKRDGHVEEVEIYQIEGKSLYVAEVDLPNQRDLKIHVRADGALVKTREDSALAETPAAVRKVVDQKLAGGRADDVEKETTAGTVTYHVEIDRKGSPDLKLAIAEDGRIMAETEDTDD